MNKRAIIVTVAVAVVVLAVIAVRYSGHRVPPATPVPSPPEPAAFRPPKANDIAPAPAPDALSEQLKAALQSIRGQSNSGPARPQLPEIRQALAAMPTNQAVAAIRQILDSKQDAPTGQGFKINGKGFLDQAPTLRTWLLDYLGQIDPASAAAYARVILSSMDAPDEWAIALRSLALGDTGAEARSLLQQKMNDLLRYQPWQTDPSSGYLESFDVAVYLGGTSLVAPLTDLVRKQDNPAVAHAAYLALDRLVINDASGLLNSLVSDPQTMQGRELTRADFFARADVRNPAQRQVLESYLLDGRFGAAELDHFTSVYPSANYMVSANLLTPTPTPDHAALVSRDAESLRVLQEWLADPRFINLRPQLEKTRARLEEFRRQEAGK